MLERTKASIIRETRYFKEKKIAKRTIRSPQLYLIIRLAIGLNGSKRASKDLLRFITLFAHRNQAGIAACDSGVHQDPEVIPQFLSEVILPLPGVRETRTYAVMEGVKGTALLPVQLENQLKRVFHLINFLQNELISVC